MDKFSAQIVYKMALEIIKGPLNDEIEMKAPDMFFEASLSTYYTDPLASIMEEIGIFQKARMIETKILLLKCIYRYIIERYESFPVEFIKRTAISKAEELGIEHPECADLMNYYIMQLKIKNV